MAVLERAGVVVLRPTDKFLIRGPVCERVISYDLPLLVEVKQDAFEFLAVHVCVQF